MTDPIERVARVLDKLPHLTSGSRDLAKEVMLLYDVWLTEQGIPIDKLLKDKHCPSVVPSPESAAAGEISNTPGGGSACDLVAEMLLGSVYAPNGPTERREIAEILVGKLNARGVPFDKLLSGEMVAVPNDAKQESFQSQMQRHEWSRKAQQAQADYAGGQVVSTKK